MAALADLVPEQLLAKIILQPTVTCLAKTQIYGDEEFEQYPDSFTGYWDKEYDDGEYLLEFAGRECYQSFHNPAGRTTGGYLANIRQQKHTSVLEHCHVTFRVQGISRSCSHDWVRHRHFNYSMMSQRYVDLDKVRYVLPPLYIDEPQMIMNWAESIYAYENAVQKLDWWSDSWLDNDLPRKVRREAVRSLLPNSTETKLVVTGNLLSWSQFLEKRWSAHADKEIQRAAGLIAAQLKHLYPSVFEDVQYVDN